VYVDPNGEQCCTVRFNPARFVDPWGIGLCPQHRLGEVLEEVLLLLDPYVEVIVEPGEMQVRRLDIARNFYGIAEPTRYLDGLRGIPRKHARVGHIYFDPRRESASQTLSVGSQTQQGRLYDKHAQLPDLAEPGTMRFEVEARRRWCECYGEIVQFNDIIPSKIDNLILDRVEWFGLQNEVMTFETTCERIINDETVETRLKVALLQFLSDTQRGRPSGKSARTVAHYKRILRSRRIAPVLDAQYERSITRLDFETGTEVQIS
jgi:hypothetical protein